MAKPARKPQTVVEPQTVAEPVFASTDEAHESLISDVLARLADAATAQADKGKMALDALLTFSAYANDRVGGNKTQAYQRLAAIADPALLGKRSGFKGRKPFLIALFGPTLGPLDSKGAPDATLYLKVLNAWRHDVRQGLADMARGGRPKRKGGRKPYTLAAALVAVEKFSRLKSQDDRNTVKIAFDKWYAKASEAAAAA